VIELRDLPANPRILVITLRRIGDTLLTTPLVRMLRRGFPQATLDMLVFQGSEGILAGNPDIDNILKTPQRMSVAQTISLAGRLWRRYDLAISTQAGDRPAFLAMLAGRRRVGLVPAKGDTGAWWKSWAYHCPVPAESDNHRVSELLRLAAVLGLPGTADVVVPKGPSVVGLAPSSPYAVIHAHPMYRYKRWTEAGWRALAQGLASRGLALVATGGPDADERSYLDALWAPGEAAIKRLDGRLGWPQLAELLAGAAVYIGPDTSMTHLAAGAGCPTVALYGPTDPRLWGPWPTGGLDRPWAAAGSIQRRGNVWLVQNSLPCTPCQKEGCERHLESHSQCLDELSVGQVFAAVDQALAWSRERGGVWRGGEKIGMEGDMSLPAVKP
jgi:lipopolysaccharide heptosyltransferase III